jgi:hypothetical protein
MARPHEVDPHRDARYMKPTPATRPAVGPREVKGSLGTAC